MSWAWAPCLMRLPALTGAVVGVAPVSAALSPWHGWSAALLCQAVYATYSSAFGVPTAIPTAAAKERKNARPVHIGSFGSIFETR